MTKVYQQVSEALDREVYGKMVHGDFSYFVKNCSSVFDPGRTSVNIFQLMSTEEISDMFTYTVLFLSQF